MAAASAVLLPEMPEMNMPTTTFTCASPPRRCPTSAMASFTRRSEMPPSVMTLPARKKKGSASRVNALMPVNICWTATTSGRSATQITSSEHRIREKEIGTPIAMNRVIDTSRSVSGWVTPRTRPGERGTRRRRDARR